MNCNRVCVICGKEALHNHHVIFRSKWAEGETVADNIIPVCPACHVGIHSKKIKVPDPYWLKANQAYGKWLKEAGRKIPETQDVAEAQTLFARLQMARES